MHRRTLLGPAAGLLAAMLALPALAQGVFQLGGLGGLSALRLPPPHQSKLGITAEQKPKLQALAMRQGEEMRGLFMNLQGNPQEAFQKLRELNDKYEAEAVAILTPEQKKQLDAWKAVAAKYQGVGRASLALVLVDGITADQDARIKALATGLNTKRRELFQAVQGGTLTPQEVPEKMVALETESAASVRAVLTPDQQTRYDEVLKAIPAGRTRIRQQ